MTKDIRDPFNVEAVRLSKTLPEERRQEFIEYVLRGTATKAFMKYMETDKDAQAALDASREAQARLMMEQMDALAKIARDLNEKMGKSFQPARPPAP